MWILGLKGLKAARNLGDHDGTLCLHIKHSLTRKGQKPF